MWRTITEAISAIVKFIVDAVDHMRRKRAQERAEAERAKIDEDPAGWLRDSFSSNGPSDSMPDGDDERADAKSARSEAPSRNDGD